MSSTAGVPQALKTVSALAKAAPSFKTRSGFCRPLALMLELEAHDASLAFRAFHLRRLRSPFRQATPAGRFFAKLVVFFRAWQVFQRGVPLMTEKRKPPPDNEATEQAPAPSPSEKGTPSEQAIMGDGQLGSQNVDSGPERRNPEGLMHTPNPRPGAR